MDRFKAAYRGRDVLLIDDVQFLERKAKTEEELFHTFNELYELGSQLVLAADRAARATSPTCEQRLTERFESRPRRRHHPARLLHAPDHPAQARPRRRRRRSPTPSRSRSSPTACREHPRARGGADPRRRLPLADRPPHRRRAGRARCSTACTAPRPRHRRSVREIQDAVCDALRASATTSSSRARKAARLAWPRQIGMYLSRELTDQTLPTIGRHFGGRNHATVLHAWKRTAARMSVGARRLRRRTAPARRLGDHGCRPGPLTDLSPSLRHHPPGFPALQAAFAQDVHTINTPYDSFSLI